MAEERAGSEEEAGASTRRQLRRLKQWTKEMLVV
jgi:hypothetical protein